MTVKQAGYAVFLLVCAICSFFAVIGVSFADDGIGMVITLEGRAVARRNGSDAALALKDRVFKGDTVTAFAGAKIQILLDDDSAITISQNSTVQISDFLDSGSVSKFSAHLAEGRARIVTGRITENNPEGFKVTTKHAAIGIRGTILTVVAEEDKTLVYVENTDKAVFVNGAAVPEFNMATVRGGGEPEVNPLSREDRENEELFQAGGPDAQGGGEEPRQNEAWLPAGGGLPEQTAADIRNPVEPIVLAVPRLAHASGTLSVRDAQNNLAGDFGFDLNLDTRNISGAHFTMYGTYNSPTSIAAMHLNDVNRVAETGGFKIAMNLNDGNGVAETSGFKVENFAGFLTMTPPESGAVASTFVDNGSYIKGDKDLLEGGNFSVTAARIDVRNIVDYDDLPYITVEGITGWGTVVE